MRSTKYHAIYYRCGTNLLLEASMGKPSTHLSKEPEKTGTHKIMCIPALETILEYYNFHLYIFYFEPKENLTGNVYLVATFLLPFIPGFHAGIFDTTRRASLSREGLTERTISG